MQCWICRREARGFRCADVRASPGELRYFPLDWVFCSRCCQDKFSVLLVRWKAAWAQGLEPAMDELSEIERQASHACLRAFGQAAEAIGFDKPLGAYSEAEAMAVITAIVTRFSTEMQAQHVATREPPMRCLRVSHERHRARCLRTTLTTTFRSSPNPETTHTSPLTPTPYRRRVDSALENIDELCTNSRLPPRIEHALG